MAEFPSLPLFTDAYLGDTTHLTTIEHGAYLLLLMAMWRSPGCNLPADDRLLARYARLTPKQWERMKPTLMAFFDVENGRMSQGRLTDEYNIVRRQRGQQSDRAKTRWLKNKQSPDAAAMPEGCLPTHTHIEEDGGGGDAQAREPDHSPGEQVSPPASLITPEAHALADELATIAGVGTGRDTPPGWCGAAYRVQTWISRGWGRDAILIGARAAMARKRDGPPFSVAFFEAPIAREIAAQAKPLPTVVELPGATIHAGPSPGPQTDRSVVSAARRLVDRLAELDRPADGGEPRPAVAGLLPPGRR